MGDSLRDQLLKAGLANESHLKKAKAGDRRQNRQANQQKRSGGGPAPQRESTKLAQDAIEQKKARDRELNRKLQSEREQQAAEAQARDMVVEREISRPQSEKDISFNFTHGGKIKHVYVNPDLHKQLTAGELAICRTRGRYRLVPKGVAQKVQPIAPYLVAYLSDGPAQEDPAYAEHPIPDDLMW
jgi:uncharacterized protein YaiL (DUF2058 family)